MSTYQITELITSHHLELERLCSDLLEVGSRLDADDSMATDAFRERVRALGWRLRAHRAEEAAALIAAAGDGRAALLSRMRHEVARVEAVIERTATVERPLEAARVACDAARECRAELDRLAHAAA